ncbi:hypothetical protein INT46_008920 [Mucor plumbeus]|uniref:Uncharacterized protein n=1 Tax=Mucor plumbeus TaxID=97098 RepID=A0A8H7QCN8_9FUNG|nr:hypothetical protein INT46_008920 [Mucor plumbeus]
MVLQSNRNKKATRTIDELFKKAPPNRSKNEDEDLLRAIQLSQQEHVNEQKKLLEQYSLLSQRQFDHAAPHTTKKRRLIKMEDKKNEEEKIEDITDDDEDQWFQTVSIRPQPPFKKPQQKQKLKQKEKLKQKHKSIPSKAAETATIITATTSASMTKSKDTTNNIIKKENNETILDIENVEDWLEAKLEKPEASDVLEITDLEAFLKNYDDEPQSDLNTSLKDYEDEPQSIITIDDEEGLQENVLRNVRLVACPLCQRTFKEGKEIQKHAAKCNNMISDTDSDSDCDIIDLINPANNHISKQTVSVQDEAEEDDDGYLSPLEGFTSIKNGQNNEAFNPYFEQLQQPLPKPRATRPKKTTNINSTRKTTPRRGGRGGGRGRFKWYKKKKKS